MRARRVTTPSELINTLLAEEEERLRSYAILRDTARTVRVRDLDDAGRLVARRSQCVAAIVTFRIDPDLLAALRRRANREGRSVSAEVTRMIRKEIGPTRPPRRKKRRTMGMFADFEAPDLEAFKQLRRGSSTRLRKRVRETGRFR
jgi:hypothetical protein